MVFVQHCECSEDHWVVNFKILNDFFQVKFFFLPHLKK